MTNKRTSDVNQESWGIVLPRFQVKRINKSMCVCHVAYTLLIQFVRLRGGGDDSAMVVGAFDIGISLLSVMGIL